jgi:hypothetical protein
MGTPRAKGSFKRLYSLRPAVLPKSSKTNIIVILLCYPRACSVPSLLHHTRLQCHLFWDEIQMIEGQLKRDGGRRNQRGSGRCLKKMADGSLATTHSGSTDQV